VFFTNSFTSFFIREFVVKNTNKGEVSWRSAGSIYSYIRALASSEELN